MTANIASAKAHEAVVFRNEGGYEYDVSHDVWKLSRDTSLTWSIIRRYCDYTFVDSFKKLLASLATTSSADHIYAQYNRVVHFCKWHFRTIGLVTEISTTSLANYRADLNEKDQWYLSVVSGTVRQWAERELPGVQDGMIPMLDGWRLSGNRKGEAVQLRSPTKGALSELEFEALNSALVTAFEREHISLSNFVLVMLAAFSGRRPSQLGDLKGEDFFSSESNDGLVEFALNVPRRKQRGRPFRASFKPFALNSDNGSGRRTYR